MLPAVSTALHGVFYGNPKLVSCIPTDCVRLLEASYKLRNKLLFRECFVHVMGPARNPRFKVLESKELEVLAQKRWDKLQKTILDTQLKILQCEIQNPHGIAKILLQVKQDIARVHTSISDQDPMMPLFYRHVHTRLYGSTATSVDTIRKLIEPLLENKLVLDQSGMRAGERDFKDSFLFFELHDQDLPWDVNQRVW